MSEPTHPPTYLASLSAALALCLCLLLWAMCVSVYPVAFVCSPSAGGIHAHFYHHMSSERRAYEDSEYKRNLSRLKAARKPRNPPKGR